MDKSLIEHLLCPICLDLPLAEVYQCVNGHPICASCLSGIQFNTGCCPQCRAEFSEERIRNRVVETLIEAIPLECHYAEFGCEEKVPKGQASVHAKTCSYRPLRLCKLLDFDCEFLAHPKNHDKLIDHLRQSHGVIEVEHGVQIRFADFRAFCESEDCPRKLWTPVVINPIDSGRFLVVSEMIRKMDGLVWNVTVHSLSTFGDHLQLLEVELEGVLTQTIETEEKKEKKFQWSQVTLPLRRIGQVLGEADDIKGNHLGSQKFSQDECLGVEELLLRVTLKHKNGTPPSENVIEVNAYEPRLGLSTTPPQMANDKFRWIGPAAVTSQLHLLESQGYQELHGFKLYLCRGKHDGHFIPGRYYKPREGASYTHEGPAVSFAGQEHYPFEFEVLYTPPGSTEWVSCSGANVPENAIAVGTDPLTLEATYFGRALHEGYPIPGKVVKSRGICSIGFWGSEYIYKNYEVLVLTELGKRLLPPVYML